jgi:hypothetical protein
MNATETLKRVKAILGLTVSLEQMKLDNGTVIEAEKFEAGESVFIVTEDEKVALPVGEYELEDGTKLIIEEEGIIAQYGEGEVEEVEEEETEEVEAEDEKEMAYVSKEEFVTALEEIVAMIEDLKSDKKEMSEEVSEELQKEVTDEEVELNTQLSEPATEPLKHAPKEESKFTPKFKFNKNTNKSAYDVIVEKINNFNNK